MANSARDEQLQNCIAGRQRSYRACSCRCQSEYSDGYSRPVRAVEKDENAECRKYYAGYIAESSGA